MRGDVDQVQHQLRGARNQLRHIEEQLKLKNGPMMAGGLQQRAEELKKQIRALETKLRDLIEEAEAPMRLHEMGQRAYWFQRLNTSMAIAHGAGFAAVSAHLFDPATKPADVLLSLPAMGVFGLGAIVAGAIPWPLAYDMKRHASWLTIIAAVLFVAAIVLAVGGAALKAMA